MRLVLIFALPLSPLLHAAVGDPQLATNHALHPGKLAMSSFERLTLTQAAQYEGCWALLGHDLSTIIYDVMGISLPGLDVVSQNHECLTKRDYHPERQKGGGVCELNKNDSASYATYCSAEHRSGHAGRPTLVQLGKGESLRRWFKPWLEDGKTFAFWGIYSMAQGSPRLEN